MSSDPTQFTFVQIGSSDRRADTLRADIWRTVNSVGNCQIVLRNTEGKYNNLFDIQDTITIAVQPPGAAAGTTIFRGRVDGGGAVNARATDGESIWDEYMVIKGVDKWQDMLFHNDFEKQYADTNTQIKDVLGDLFDAPTAIDTNIIYNTPAGATPVIGSTEFREGTSFIGTIQDALRNAGWNAYVNDTNFLQAGSPGFSATAEILTNTGSGRNILDIVDLIERDGDKLYNSIKLIGKNPLFDAYLEQNSASWITQPLTNKEDVTTPVMVGTYAQRVYNNNPVDVTLRHRLTLPIFNYDTWDFTKGEIGIWGYYDNQAASGGADPGAGAAASNMRVECRLYDINGQIANYYGDSSRLYIGEYGFCTFPLGEDTDNASTFGANGWTFPFGGNDFDWSQVIDMWFQLPRSDLAGNLPSNFIIDGITMPIPALATADNVGSQTTYRKRPLVLNMPNLQTQNTLQSRADQLLTHHEATNINYLKLSVEGNVNLHYAGESYTVNIPELGLNNSIFYSTQIHHAIEPYVDVSDGFGFDYITEIEGSPIFSVAYDMSRFGDRQLYSGTQISQFAGAGIRVK